MCGNRAQDATKSHTRTEDAQDAQDANWTSLASGCKADVSDALYIFADAVSLCKDTCRLVNSHFANQSLYARRLYLVSLLNIPS